MQEATLPELRARASMPSTEEAPIAPVSREKGLDRAVQILDFLHAHQRPIAIGDLAKQLGAPRSTIYTLVKSLSAVGFVETVGEDGRIFFGKKLYLYGMDYMRENDLVRRGREEVDRLSRDTGETAELCMLQNGRYTIIHMCPGARPFRISSAVGLQIPLPWTASGRLLLSNLSTVDIDFMVSDDDLVLPDGRRIERETFKASIEDARRLGHCITSGLVDAYTMCLAAPVYDAVGAIGATLCLVVPIDTPSSVRSQLLAVLLERAGKLSIRSNREKSQIS
jgi:DNA-binding IclR family transcriptional regulator